MRCEATAHAMAVPSAVAVPRPNSSSATSEFAVARRNMAPVSLNSTINVDCPPARLSFAPMRTNTASMAVISNFAAGTSAPTCAIIAAKHTCRKYVDFPPIFGPVIKQNPGASPPSRTSFGTKDRANDDAQGCDNLSATSDARSVGGVTVGVHTAPHDAFISSLTTASEPKTSMIAPTFAAACHLAASSQNVLTMRRNTPASAASRASCASTRASRNGTKSSHVNLSYPFLLPSRTQCEGTLPANLSGSSTKCVSLLALTNTTSVLCPPSVARAASSHDAKLASALASASSAASRSASTPRAGSILPLALAAPQSNAASMAVSAVKSGIEAPPMAVNTSSRRASSHPGTHSALSNGDFSHVTSHAAIAAAASRAARMPSRADKKSFSLALALSSYNTTCAASRPFPLDDPTTREIARSVSGASRKSLRAIPVASTPDPRSVLSAT